MGLCYLLTYYVTTYVCVACNLREVQNIKNTMANNRVYFPNLNSMRFLAAVMVIIHHVEMAKHWFGLPNIYTNSFVGGVFGKLAIISFFVLSGFLITYLLLEEHRRSATISIKSFYWRRILRIWPVYYLVVILSLFVLPQFSFLDIPGLSEHIGDAFTFKSILYLTFLPNLGYTLYEHIPYASQTWSVGVEEQFYLLWPVLMLFALRTKKVLHVLIGVISFYLLVKVGIAATYSFDYEIGRASKIWQFWDHFAIDCMAIGGVGAYLLFYKKERILRVLYNKYLQVALYITLTIITVKGLAVSWFTSELYAILFVIAIINLSSNKRNILNLEYKWLNYFGKTTYGMYMYHNLVLIVVLKLMLMYSTLDVSSWTGGVIYHTISLVVTMILAAISYEYFEKPFLGIKERFAKVKSGDEVEEVAPNASTEPIQTVQTATRTA